MALNFPNSPTNGQLYTDSASGNRWVWDSGNTCWVSTSTFTQTITVASSAPGSPVAGQLWWNKDYGRLLVYYTDNDTSQWVDASPSDYTSQLAYNNSNAAFGKANTALQNTSGTFAGDLTVTGNTSIFGTQSFNAGNFTPQGRVCLTSGQPVVSSTQTAKTTIYYTPYIGSFIPVFNGTLSIATPFSELSVALDATNVLSGKLYDLFVYNDNGIVRFGYGPAWTNSSTRSASLALKNGINTNAASMVIRYSSSATTTVAANQATYVGTFYATANGQTGVSYGAQGSGGANPIVGIFNAFNRVPISVYNLDTSGTYTYATVAWRPRNNSTNNRISYVDGLGVFSARAVIMNTVECSSSNPAFAMALNATDGSGFAVYAQPYQSGRASVCNSFGYPPAMGFNFIQEMELDGNTNAFTANYAAPGSMYYGEF